MYPNKRFLESIKVEQRQPQLLEFHQKRVERTFATFGDCNRILDLNHIFQNLNFPTDIVYKWRISYDMEGYFETEILPYEMTEIKSFQMVEAHDLDYAFKYENRDIFAQLKEKSTAEEIIITQKGQITDTTFSNLIFLKNEQWFTPKTYLLNGVQRQFLLSQNIITETEISMKNIKDFSHFSLINAMRNLENAKRYPLEQIQNLP